MLKYFKIFSTTFALLCAICNTAFAAETLSWPECVKEAAKNNPDLISAQEGVNETQANKVITASALFPQIESSLSASYGKATAVDEASSYSYGVSAGQIIFDGFKTLNSVKSAGESIKAAQQSYRFASSQVRLSLRTAFINLLKAQEFIHVAEDIVKIRKDNFDLIELRYQSGLEHEGALLTAEANVAQANLEFSQAKRNEELAQRELAKEMGREEFAPISVKGEFTVNDAARAKPDFNAIVKNNPSLLVATAKKNAASFDVKSAYADFSPQISASATVDKSGPRWSPRNNEWSTGVGVSMPIFEGGLRTAQVSKAQALYRQAQANEKSAKVNAVLNLAQTWSQLQDAVEAVDVQRKVLDAALKRAEIAEAQYSIGFIAFDSWTIIEDNLVAAKKSFLDTQSKMLIVEAGWIQAKGETVEYE